MFFTSRKKYLANNSRVVKISADSNLPHLFRLCSDFGFAVVANKGASATPKSYMLCEVGLSSDTSEPPKPITPEMPSLIALEGYAERQMVEIVQKYLFGDDAAGESDFAVA